MNLSVTNSQTDTSLELLIDELTDRLQAGESIDFEAYAQVHPDHAEQLRKLVPALEMMVHLKRSAVLGAARTSPPGRSNELELGELGDFRLVREVGRGAMGIVYEAEQISLRRRVALKVLPFAAALDARQIQRFQVEAQAAACLHHPHIVPVHGVGCERGVHYYAMQLIDGQSLAAVIGELRRLDGLDTGDGPNPDPIPISTSTLANRLLCGHASERPDGVGTRSPALRVAAVRNAAESPTPRTGRGRSAGTSSHTRDHVRAAARLGLEAALALDHAHAQGILHRDIKPGNLMLDAAGRLWITDFGLAQVRGDDRLTLSGDVLGTLRYMSPEQALGRRVVIDGRTDIYSLGVTLYELLTLRPAVDGRDRAEVLRRIAEHEPAPLRRLNPAVPRDLETIVTKAMDKDPVGRYATAGDLVMDLRRFLEDRPIRARRVYAAERFLRWCKRNPVVAALVAAVFVLLAAVAGVASVGYVQTKRALNGEGKQRAAAEAAEQEMRRQWYAASINLMQLAWDTGQVSRLRALLAQAEAYPERGFEWSYWQRLCHLEQHTLIGHRDQVTSVSWSPDGTRLATGSKDGTAKVWEAASGRELLTLKGHAGEVGAVSGSANDPRYAMSVSWSPDGTRLATGSWDSTAAKVWEAAGGRELLTLEGHAGGVSSVSWSPDGTRLATGSGDGTAKVWDASSGRELLTLKGQTGEDASVSWSPDGTRLATGGMDDGTAKVWDAAGGRELLTVKGHTNVVRSVSWSPDGQRLATGGSDGTAKVWDAASGRELLTLKGHVRSIGSVSWSPDGTRLATGSADSTAKVWDAVGGGELLTLKGHTGWVVSVSWSPNGTRLATGSYDGTAKVWEGAGGRELLTLKGHAGGVSSVSWSPDGTRLATAGWDRTAKVWDAAGGRELLALKGHTKEIPSVSWSPDGTRLATGSYDGTAKVWEAAGGRELLTLKGHAAEVWSVSWSPDATRLATASGDGTAKVWEAAGGRELLTLKGHTGNVRSVSGSANDLRQAMSVSWSPDGTRLATGSWDGTAKVWEAAGGRELLTLKGHTNVVRFVSWSPDGQRLATGSDDGTAKVWEAAGGRELLTLKGHTGWVPSVSWSPDGQRLATGSYDGTAKVWEAAGGRELLTLKGHAGNIRSVAWSPDGQRLATGSYDGTAKVWEAAGAQAVQEWARQDRAVQDLLDSNDFRSPQAQ